VLARRRPRFTAWTAPATAAARLAAPSQAARATLADTAPATSRLASGPLRLLGRGAGEPSADELAAACCGRAPRAGRLAAPTRCSRARGIAALVQVASQVCAEEHLGSMASAVQADTMPSHSSAAQARGRAEQREAPLARAQQSLMSASMVAAWADGTGVGSHERSRRPPLLSAPWPAAAVVRARDPRISTIASAALHAPARPARGGRTAASDAVRAAPAWREACTGAEWTAPDATSPARCSLPRRWAASDSSAPWAARAKADLARWARISASWARLVAANGDHCALAALAAWSPGAWSSSLSLLSSLAMAAVATASGWVGSEDADADGIA